MNKKLIIEIDEDFCPKCFTRLNTYLRDSGFKMIRMQRVEEVKVYKWIEHRIKKE